MQCALGGGTRAVRRVRADDEGSRRRGSKPALDIVRRLCAGEEVTTERAVPRSSAPASRPFRRSRSRCGSAARPPAAIDRAARLGRRVPRRAGGDARRGAASSSTRTARRAPATAGHRRRSRSAATSTSAPTTPTRTGSRGPSWRAATGASTPRRPSRAAIERVAAAFADLGEMGYTDVIVRHLADDQTEVLRVLRTARGRARRSCNRQDRGVEPRWIADDAALDDLVAEVSRGAPVRPRHRVPRRTLVLAPARADPDRVDATASRSSIRSRSTRRRSRALLEGPGVHGRARGRAGPRDPRPGCAGTVPTSCSTRRSRPASSGSARRRSSRSSSGCSACASARATGSPTGRAAR